MGRMRYGVNPHLEDLANGLIKTSLAGVTKHSDKADILTPWKEEDRRRREVYNMHGVADSTQRQGLFHRSSNPARPELNSRDGIAQPRNVGGSLAAHIEATYTGRYEEGAVSSGSLGAVWKDRTHD